MAKKAERIVSLALSAMLMMYNVASACASQLSGGILNEDKPVQETVRPDEDGVVVSKHSNSSSKIALTFDDGPHPKLTREILDILSQYEVSATFFVIGKNAEAYPELVKAEIDGGHEVGNHTYSHANLKRESVETIKDELDRAERAVYEAAEYRPKLIRPPGGNFNESFKNIAEEYNSSIILWNVDTRDWAHNSVDAICKNVLSNVKCGDIILFHDHITGGSPTPEALRRIIPELKSRGFTFATVSELIGSD